MVQGQQLGPVQQVTPQWIQGVMAAILIVWIATYVLSQMVKVFKGEEIEKPPLF